MGDKNTLNTSSAHLESSWRLLAAEDSLKVKQALHNLAQHRPFIGRVPLARAQLLISKVEQYTEAWSQADPHSDALLVLARWCYTSVAESSGDKATRSKYQQLLAQAIELTLPVGTQSTSPKLLAAAALFLSAAATVSSSEAAREPCQGALCDLLHSKRQCLQQSHLLTEVIGAVGRLLSTHQGKRGVLWLLALLLDLWTPQPAAAAEQEQPGTSFRTTSNDAKPSKASNVEADTTGNGSNSQPSKASSGSLSSQDVLDQMAALYGALRLVARTWSTRNASAELQALTFVLESSLHSPDREVQCAGILAAGGVLEGCLKGSQTPSASSAAQQVEGVLVAGSRIAAQLQDSWTDTTARLLRNAAALSLVMTNQATGHPTSTPATLEHLLHVLLEEVLSLDGLFSAAASRNPPALANEWLHRQLAGQLMRNAGSFARSVVQQYAQLDSPAQQAVRDALRTFVLRLHQAYSQYALCTPREWLAQVDGNAVRQILDKVFMTAVILLTAIWEAAARPVALHAQGGSRQQQALAADIIDQLAYLQFCRLRVTAYTSLLQQTLTVAVNSEEAASELLSRLPCYADLVAPSRADESLPRWEADLVLATVLQFRLSILAPCIPRLPQAKVLETALPTTYLLLLHPHPPVVAASHSLFCAILGRVDEKQQLAPFYVRRALEGYPARTPLNALTMGMDALARSLPAGSPMMLLCIQRISARCLDMLKGNVAEELQPALDLVHLLAYLLLVMDVQVLPDARDIVEKFVLASPDWHRQKICSSLGKVLASSDDHVRKVQLVQWFQGLQASL